MSTTSFYVLFESAAGYGLFSILESDEISTLADEVQSGLSDFSKFQRVVKMVSFLPFLTAESALENINAISEHELTDELKVTSSSPLVSFLTIIS
jgi:nucleolar protein 56